MKNWRAEMAYAEGRVVTQGHADYCEENGHARHTVDGVDQVFCPRCGEPSDAEPLPVSEAESRLADARAAFREDVEGPVVPSRGRPMSAGRLRSMRPFVWAGGERIELGESDRFARELGPQS